MKFTQRDVESLNINTDGELESRCLKNKAKGTRKQSKAVRAFHKNFNNLVLADVHGSFSAAKFIASMGLKSNTTSASRVYRRFSHEFKHKRFKRYGTCRDYTYTLTQKGIDYYRGIENADK